MAINSNITFGPVGSGGMDMGTDAVERSKPLFTIPQDILHGIIVSAVTESDGMRRGITEIKIKLFNSVPLRIGGGVHILFECNNRQDVQKIKDACEAILAHEVKEFMESEFPDGKKDRLIFHPIGGGI